MSFDLLMITAIGVVALVIGMLVRLCSISDNACSSGNEPIHSRRPVK